MEWYVLNYNPNKKKVETFNIFRSYRFSNGVEDLLKNYITFEDFLGKLKQEIKYCFWAKRECEISVGDAFCEGEGLERWDISMQLLPNIKTLALYIIEEYNKNLKK